MASISALRKAYLQEYSRGVYADFLKKEGFKSYNGDDLSWYRVVNHEVLQSFYIFTIWGDFPITPMLGYGAYPLYISIPFPMKPYPTWERGSAIREVPAGRLKYMAADYSDTVPVTCPEDTVSRIWSFMQHIYPKFEQLQTIEASYAHYREGYAKRDKHNLPQEAIDQVLYWEDRELYPVSLERLNWLIPFLEETLKTEAQKNNPRKAMMKVWERDLDIAILQREALLGNRESYLICLETRKRDFIKKLEKQGIPV